MTHVSQAFFTTLRTDLGATVPMPEWLVFCRAWELKEGTNATNNPFATSYPMPGSSNFNSLGGGQGVQNYPDEATGEKATFYTLIGGQSRVGDYAAWTNPKLNRYAGLLEAMGTYGSPSQYRTYHSDINTITSYLSASGWSGQTTASYGEDIAKIASSIGTVPVDQQDPGAAIPEGITGGLATGVATSVWGAATSWTAALAHFFGALTSRHLWELVGQAVASLVTIAIGFVLIFRKDIVPIAKGAALA